jgi:3-hydroxypropionyl-CoA synthetase (ADP-forming)
VDADPSIYDYGFVGPRAAFAAGPAEAAALARELGFPVALKISSPDILHKTDVGGVELRLASEEEVRVAGERMLETVRRRAPEARLDGLRVEEMVPGGFEVIIGLKNDRQFGPVIMFGLGGVLTEIFDDATFRVLPIAREDAEQMIGELQGARVLQGFRGRPSVPAGLLVELLLGAARFGLDLGDRLEAVDLNPVIVWEHGHRLVDYKIVLTDAGASETPSGAAAPNARVHRPVDTTHLDTFFTARSVALVGASDTPGKIGHAVLDSLAKHEYAGKVFPVNPGRSSIQGLPSYPSLGAIPEEVEVVVCTVDLELVPGLVRECAAFGVHNLIVVSGGGKELGGDRAAAEAEVRRLARELDVRVIGPNCLGIFDGTTRLDTFFQPNARMRRPPAGPVAMLTQSGTVGISFLEDADSFGVSKFVSYGNRADVDEADLLTYLTDDPATRVIALYVEGFDNGRGFLKAARSAAEKKPVVVFKTGRSSPAAGAALSHTGFFAGSYKVAEGAFRQAGVIAVDSYEALVAAAKALALQPRARGGQVGLLGNGIGTIVQALDLMAGTGLRPAALSERTLAHLRASYPPFYIVQNPLDVTGSATSEDYRVGIQALLDDPGVDIVMPWFVFQDVPLGEDVAIRLAELDLSRGKPIVGAAMGADFTRRMSAEIERIGIPIFHAVSDWVAAARALAPRA